MKCNKHGPIGSVTVSTDRHRPDTASGLTAGAISFMLTLLETDGHTADLGGDRHPRLAR